MTTAATTTKEHAGAPCACGNPDCAAGQTGETTEPRVRVAVRYGLTKDAQRALVLRGKTTPIEQEISVELNLSEALALEAAEIQSDGAVRTLLVNIRQPRAYISDSGTIELDRDRFGSPVFLDHIVDEAEALALLRGQQERAARAIKALEPEAAAKRAQLAAARDRVRPVLARLRAGEAQIATADTGYPYWVKLTDGSQLSHDDLDQAEWKSVVVPLVEAMRGAEAERKGAAERAAAAERDAWIAAHGSERLRKCATLGLSASCHGIYLDERLALEAPGFFWDPPGKKQWEESEIRNPSLAALAALEEARRTWPEAALFKIRAPSSGDEADDWATHAGEWLEAVRIDGGPDLPWAPGKLAYLLVQG